MSYRVTTIYRKHGLVGLLLRVLNKLPGVDCVLLYYWYRVSFEELLKSPVTPGFNFKMTNDSSVLADLIRVHDKTDIFNERFSQNHSVVVVYSDETPVAYLWGQPGPTHLEQRYHFDIEIAPTEFYIYDSFVIPYFRRQGLLRGMLGFFARQETLVSEFEEFTAIIDKDNLRSIIAHERIGFRKSHLNIFAIVLGKRFHKKL
jgi:transposase-like protein